MVQHTYLQFLSIAEANNPHTVIRSFFDGYDLPHIKNFIQESSAAVYRNKEWNGKPNDLLYFFEQLRKLMVAISIIEKADNSQRQSNLEGYNLNFMDVDLYCPKHKQNEAFLFFPRSLSLKQYLNPYKVFKKFFSSHSLDKWDNLLHEVLHLALSEMSLHDLGNDLDMLQIKQWLDKLVDACHLIDVRELRSEKKTDGKKALKLQEA